MRMVRRNPRRLRGAVAAGLMVAAGAALAGACAGGADAPPEEWRIAVAGADGTVGASTTHAELGRRFAGAIADTMVHMGEGQFAPGTVVHGTDPLRRLEVVWHDAERTRPWRMQAAGDSTLWVIGPGITLGTRLAELERLNGRPLTLTGLGWDYGGTVMGWEQGQLEQALLGGNGRVILRLAMAPGSAGSADAGLVSGDGVFRSDDPAMRALDPAVHQIIVEYDGPDPGP